MAKKWIDMMEERGVIKVNMYLGNYGYRLVNPRKPEVGAVDFWTSTMRTAPMGGPWEPKLYGFKNVKRLLGIEE
jgi:hypothetical protein